MRSRARTLELAGYGGAPLPCAFYEGGEAEAAVVLPGAAHAGNRLGGSPARPDLNYVRAVLQSEGLAVLEVWWDAGSAPRGDLDGWLDANADAALAEAGRGGRRVVLLVGRSIGTKALARVVRRHPPVPTVWVAPLLGDRSVRAALAELTAPAFVLVGTADALFDAAVAESLRDRGATVVVLEGAGHSLETDDAADSARRLADALDELRAFVRASRP